MLTRYLEQMSDIYNNVDSILITNREGIIEYCAIFDKEDNSIKNEGYTGRPLLEIYPELNEETSSHFRVMRTGKPIMEEIQTLTDVNHKTVSFISNTYPIELDGKIVGAIEGMVFLSEREGTVNKRLRHKKEKIPKELYCIDDFVTADYKMLQMKEKAVLAAKGDSAVMIIGETGTGKEIVAQSIHSHSERNEAPFVSQNCSAIPSGLLESILFGTVKGCYTGAENRKGLFEQADKGTLFLDELNSMDIGLQGKILKAVEDKKIRRLGEEKERHVDVRLVSAINEEPVDVLESGKIRKDLYYRLGVVQIRLSQLKERKKEIPVLIKHFIEHYNEKEGKHIKGLSELAEEILIDYSWPGNVRELKNVIEYAFNMTKGEHVTITEIPENLLYDKKEVIAETENLWKIQLKNNLSIMEIVESYEKDIIKEVMDGALNLKDAANTLGISRQALHYKLMKYHII